MINPLIYSRRIKYWNHHKMYFFYSLVIAVCFFSSLIGIGKCDLNSDISKEEEGQHSLINSRKRRYVVFPEGSSFNLALSLNIDLNIYPLPQEGGSSIFTNGMAWALSYDLPNETIHEKNGRNEIPGMIRRHKRDLFIKAEKLINSAGFEGKNCILKTICETAGQLSPKQGILEEILRLIFTYPEDKLNREGRSSKMYTKAHRDGELKENCDVLYPCPMSLLELGLGFGKYPLV